MGNSNRFASADLTVDEHNAIVKKLGGRDMALRFLRDELLVSELNRSWREENGVIYFSVTSDGTTGEDWITRLEGIGDYTKQVLLSADFKPTNGVTTEVAVLRGCLFEDNDRITKKIHAIATKRKFSKPNAELACLIWQKFTRNDIKAMGLLYIVVMHERIKESDGVGSRLLRLDCDSATVAQLGVPCDGPDARWSSSHGFAFARTQPSSQS